MKYRGRIRAIWLVFISSILLGVVNASMEDPIWVDFGWNSLEKNGTELTPYNKLAEALALSPAGSRLIIKKSDSPEGITINTLVILDSCGGSSRIGVAEETSVPAEEVAVIIEPARQGDWQVTGRVQGVNPVSYSITLYIVINETVFRKAINVPIAPNGTWNVNVTSGQYTSCITDAYAFLMPSGMSGPDCQNCFHLPSVPDAVAQDHLYLGPQLKKISFAGHEWVARRADCTTDPGGNFFSDHCEDVYADIEGLHLKLSKHDGTWYGTQVECIDELGYGTYVVVTNSRLDIIPANSDFTIFLWDQQAREICGREIDVEFSRTNVPSRSLNTQFAVHAASETDCSVVQGPTLCSRFHLDLASDSLLTHFIDWQEGMITWRTYQGDWAGYADVPGDPLHEWTLTGEDVPTEGHARLNFNFWLTTGYDAPLAEDVLEVVVKDFLWQPIPPSWIDFTSDRTECCMFDANCEANL